MSDGDEEPAETTEEAGEAADTTAVDPDTLESRLDDAEAALEAASTESDLDDIEASLDAVAADIEAAELPEPDDDGEESREAALTDHLAEVRDGVDDQRGPYASDAAETVDAAQSTIAETRWTDQGEDDLAAVVAQFREAAGDALGETFDETGDLGADLAAVSERISAAGLDADADADTIESLVAATDSLDEGVADAQEWDDLSVRQKLRAEGYYEVMGDKHKDFPPEWTALKQWEQRGNVEMILLCMEHLDDSEFMQRHCLDALLHVAKPAALDAVGQLAARRDPKAIEVVGKIGVEDGLEHIEEYVAEDGSPNLRTTALKAVGEIGSRESTQVVADQLVAERADVRSQAARALGLIGDTRAIAPLVDILESDDSETVRASAAWALVQIGTEAALEAAAEYADDRAYVVEQEATKAVTALDHRDAADASTGSA
ncbi:HEAT repeat domain-containing protein [Halobacterium sp. BOL4-2]|uniref:HEAT repeat domain-containing protein n=1 Tax=Halobacterium sp. BOL4-2 TaxID=2810537 RepID=UPI0019667422|nr:HEAT repeat domain-containing protein [Halobacterium sp. BOL4-2]QRY25388.1 HEAT repeat domain-containing protein [Halobacterium sp. BOL4-2]